MNQREKYIFLAALIEGEGSFYISNKFNNRMLITNTSKTMINWLHENFKGYVYERISKTNPNWRNKFEWILERGQVFDICENILPFMLCKKEHTQVMIEFRKTYLKKYGHHVPQEITETRKRCYERLKYLNSTVI